MRVLVFRWLRFSKANAKLETLRSLEQAANSCRLVGQQAGQLWSVCLQMDTLVIETCSCFNHQKLTDIFRRYSSS